LLLVIALASFAARERLNAASCLAPS
jgi:hypothetical protein